MDLNHGIKCCGLSTEAGGHLAWDLESRSCPTPLGQLSPNKVVKTKQNKQNNSDIFAYLTTFGNTKSGHFHLQSNPRTSPSPSLLLTKSIMHNTPHRNPQAIHAYGSDRIDKGSVFMYYTLL